MRLDFNEANMLIKTIEDLEKYKKPVNKNTITGLLHELFVNTERKNDNFLIRQSIQSLIFQLEPLSDKSIAKIYSDVKSNNIAATACYILPNL